MFANRRAIGTISGAMIALALIVCATLRAQPHEPPAPPPSAAQPALDHLKKLAGEWVYAEGANKGKPAANYVVSSGGTAVVETLFPGTNHEMVTVYHCDGDKVMMTHYCAVGNQPRMHADPADDKLVFTFTGGSNMKESDGHMHAMTMTFVDEDHLNEDWTWQQQGQGGTESFKFERKKG